MSNKHRIQCVSDLPAGLRAPVQAMLDRQRAAFEQEREIAIKRTVSLVQEIDYLATILMLIEDLGCSTNPRKRGGKDPRLQIAIRGIDRQLSYHGNVFGLEMLDGLRCKLESYGVRLEDSEIPDHVGSANTN